MSEQPGNGYTRASLRTSSPGRYIEFGGEATYSYEYPTPDPSAGWGTFTFAVIYDNAPPRTALDFVRASNRWPKPYSTALWAGALP